VCLGDANDVERAIERFREALRDPATDAASPARTLDRIVMEPVRELLDGTVSHLLISPDGALNLVPFEALVDQQQRYLIERYAVSYLTTGRDLLRLHV
jgi:CHAT domain-containing protein